MTEPLHFDQACGTSASALATSTPLGGAATVPRPHACYVHDSSQVMQHGCPSTRGESTTSLSGTRRYRVSSQVKQCWFRCQAAPRQRTGRGRPNVWRSCCMGLDWAARYGLASSDVYLSASRRLPSTPIVQPSGNTTIPSRCPRIPSQRGFRSSPLSLFSWTTSSPKAAPFLPPPPACTRPFLTLTSGPSRSFGRWGLSRRPMILSIPVRARCGGPVRMLAVSLDVGAPGRLALISPIPPRHFQLHLLFINRRRDPAARGSPHGFPPSGKR